MAGSNARKDSAELLRAAKLVVSPETFQVVSVTHEKWSELLGSPELSPLMAAEFLMFKDAWEVTIVLDERDFANLLPGLDDSKFERGFRLLSFDIEMDFDVVGFMAEVTRVLAAAEISVLPYSSFGRDHVLVRQDDLADALKCFRGIVDEVC